MDLIAFLHARLDEEEAEAEETADADAEFWSDIKGDGTHFARHDPARVLREVAAKRQTLGIYRSAVTADPIALEYMKGYVAAVEILLGSLAAAWSDHPDYDPSWTLLPASR